MVKKGSKKAIEELRTKEFFYFLDFGDIQRLLFTKTWNNYDEEQKQKFLGDYPDLTLLSDEELREKFTEFSPKSDWERFFKDKTNDTVETIISLLDEIRIFRNMIAHCKFFSSKDYEMCNKAILRLSKAIDQAIIITEEKDFNDKNLEVIRKSAERVSEILKGISEAISKFTDTMISNMELISRSFNRTLNKSFRDLIESAAQFSETNLLSEEDEDEDQEDDGTNIDDNNNPENLD